MIKVIGSTSVDNLLYALLLLDYIERDALGRLRFCSDMLTIKGIKYTVWLVPMTSCHKYSVAKKYTLETLIEASQKVYIYLHS